MEGVAGVGSEMERIHIAEKNKAMAAKLKVLYMYMYIYMYMYTRTVRALCMYSIYMYMYMYMYFVIESHLITSDLSHFHVHVTTCALPTCSVHLLPTLLPSPPS